MASFKALFSSQEKNTRSDPWKNWNRVVAVVPLVVTETLKFLENGFPALVTF